MARYRRKLGKDIFERDVQRLRQAVSGGIVPLTDLGSYARGSIIRGGASDWEAHDAKTAWNVLTGDGTDIVSRATSSNPGAAAEVLRTSAGGLLQLEGLGVRAALANADALYVPWVAGDTQTTAYFGSSNASNNQNAIEAHSNSAYAVIGTSNSLIGVAGDANTGIGVRGSSTSNIGGDFESATGIGLEVDLAGAGIAIARFTDNGAPVWTFQDGGNLLATSPATLDLNGIADALILDADADTTISAPTDDQIDFEVGGSDKMTLTATGLGIGIGVTPLVPLDVGGVNPTLAIAGTGIMAAGGTTVGRLYLEGSSQADILLDDSGGTVNQKIIQLINSGAITKFRVITDAGGIGADNILVMDHATGNLGIGTATPGSLTEWNFPDDDLEFVDAHAATGVGSINAVIECQIGGVTTYIPGYDSYS